MASHGYHKDLVLQTLASIEFALMRGAHLMAPQFYQKSLKYRMKTYVSHCLYIYESRNYKEQKKYFIIV